MVLYITLWYQIRVFTYLCGNFRYWAILGIQHQDPVSKNILLRWGEGVILDIWACRSLLNVVPIREMITGNLGAIIARWQHWSRMKSCLF